VDAVSALATWLSAHRWEDWPPADPAVLAKTEAALGVRFPADYRELVLATNGGTLTGPAEAITLWGVDELVDRNADELYAEALPEMLVVGENGGGGIYFYDPRNRIGRGTWALYWVALGAASLRTAKYAGADLREVFERVVGGVLFFDEPAIG
jgi:hypothetical protein